MKISQQVPWQKNFQKSQQGFSLLEVLVAIVVISMFLTAAMMGLAIAASFKAKARAFSYATTWIQEDLEAVKSQASQLSYSLSANATAGQPTVVLASANGLANNDQIVVGTDSNIYTIQSINGNSLTLTTNLNTTQSANSNVVPVSKCNATSSSAGFAYYLQQNLPALSSNSTRTIAGRSYTLSRNVSIKNTAPYEVLQLSYSVIPQKGGLTVAKMYSEVIPNAVYQCPKTQ